MLHSISLLQSFDVFALASPGALPQAFAFRAVSAD